MENLDYTKYFNPNLDLDKYILPMEESDKNNGLFIRITDKCNKDCTFCLSKNLKTEKDMSIENFKKVCKYYSNFSESICLYGGEPTVHPYFNEILSFAQKYYKEVIVLTNGIKKIENLRFSDKIILNGMFIHEINLDYLPTEAIITVSFLFDLYDQDKYIKIFNEIKKHNNRLHLVLATNVFDSIIKNRISKMSKLMEISKKLENAGLSFTFNPYYPLCIYQDIPLEFYKKYVGKVFERDLLTHISVGPDLKIATLIFPTNIYFDTDDIYDLRKYLFDYVVSKISIIEKELPCINCKYFYKYCYKFIFHLMLEMDFIKGDKHEFSTNTK